MSSSDAEEFGPFGAKSLKKGLQCVKSVHFMQHLRNA